jgi:hypothetical protein
VCERERERERRKEREPEFSLERAFICKRTKANCVLSRLVIQSSKRMDTDTEIEKEKEREREREK